MEQSYRIKANVGADQVVKTVLQQDMNMLEILSLKIKQKDVYKLHTSNYGMIVGRVLANEAVGIYNAKVSVFVELDDIDAKNSEITQFYPFENVYSQDENGIRYNLLKDESNDVCSQDVGTFPNKRLVLDNDTMIEIFDKYWRYTTVTNSSGDYMIPCVPVGNQQIHVDIDLSDIGVLSQKPRDFIYKGYNATQFDNANQFKYDTNLESLSQIISQNTSVYVYPFWGSEDVEQIAISRCDIQIAYKFEPTCVFFGSIISDNFSNNIGHKCNPSKNVGYNKNLVAGEGIIEMIRKTPDGLVEEFQIQGNRLIDGNGVWCYQIPMNLDYVMTDEYGNLVPANGTKGIATRTCVRFRISMQETNNEGVSRHRARYLVPNVHQLVDEFNDKKTSPKIANPSKLDQCYEFGSATPSEYFRDLYWNKVYTVKNYIPRLQINGKKNTQKYSAIRTVNDNGNLNPFPFNHGRFRIPMVYRVICNMLSIIFGIISVINTILSEIACLKILGIRPFKFLCRIMSCIAVRRGFTDDDDSRVEYFPGCSKKCNCFKCEEKGCIAETSLTKLMDTVQQNLAEEFDVVNLDFYNDWVNGTLYMPLWFWRKTKKKKYLFGLFSKKAVNTYCNCDNNYPRLRVTENCNVEWYDSETGGANTKESNDTIHNDYPSKSPRTIYGIIKEVENKDGLKIYYYSPGVATKGNYRELTTETDYVRLYSTDIVLLGSLNNCDLDNLPRPFLNLPSTSANIPYIRTLKQSLTDNDNEDSTLEGTVDESDSTIEVTGMDWESGGNKTKPRYGNGLFIDLDCVKVRTRPKTCINLSRMSELGVSLDVTVNLETPEGNTLKNNTPQIADGMITRYELVDNETRAMFASLNHNGFLQKTRNKNTGYDTYLLEYMYPNDFDGRMKDAPTYTSMMEYKTYDHADQSYIDFRLGKVKRLNGSNYERTNSHFYGVDKNDFPLYNNSFYFYFGLNEGNTAIDKFNNLFYASCHKNEKYPFTMTYTTRPAKWCQKGGEDALSTDYGTIDIELLGIKIPYSYTLYNQFNEEILTENGVYNTELKFGYLIEKSGYTDNKHGIFTQISSPNSEIVEGVKVENGVYVIEITDANGSKIKQVINLLQVGISADIEAVNLGDKFYYEIDESGNTTPISNIDDFCNENQDLYGEIIIKSIDIDGKEYGISTLTATSISNQYKVTLYEKENISNTETILLTLTTVDGNGEDCMCEERADNSSHKYVISDDKLSFHVWRPQNYQIHIIQECNGVLNDNELTIVAAVQNGEPFNAYLNNVPLKFLMSPSLYNPNANQIYELAGWINLEKTMTYQWPTVSATNRDIWSDFVSLDVDGETNELTLDSRLSILEYQLKSMFALCNAAYITHDSYNTFSLTSSGGKPKILYRGNYPEYYNMQDITWDNKFESWVFDSDATVTSNNYYPNIISENYTVYNDQYDYYIPLVRWKEDWFKSAFTNPFQGARAMFNPLYTCNEGAGVNNDYSNKKNTIGNYFAAFTNNGGIVKDENGFCKQESGNGYKELPSDANPQYGICPGTSNIVDDRQDSKYYRALFTDKRFDYDMIIWAPTFRGTTTNITSNTDYRLGRISGVTYNGIAMAYDGEYNIIGDDLEYKVNNTFDKIEYNIGDGTSFPPTRKFYKAEVRLDDGVIDLHKGCFTEAILGTYPMRRDVNIPFGEIDGKYLKPTQKLTFNVTSCSYDVDVDFRVDGDTTSCKAYVEPGDETSFVVDCRSQISVISSGLSVMAQADKADLTYNSSGEVENVNFKFKIGQDGYNRTHRITTFLPFFWEAKQLSHLETQIYNLKQVTKFSDTTDEGREVWRQLYNHSGDNATSPKTWDSIKDKANFMKLLVEYTHKNGNNRAHGTKDIWKSAEYDGSLRPVTNDILCDTLNTDYRFHEWYTGEGDRAHHWVENEDNDKIVYDDDSRIRNIIYSVDRPSPVLGIVLLRQYINDDADNLSKNIMVVNTSAIFDFTKTISVDNTNCGVWEKDITTNSGETKVSGSGDVYITINISGATDSDRDTVEVQSSGSTTLSSITYYSNSITLKIQTSDKGWFNGTENDRGNMEAVLMVNGIPRSVSYEGFYSEVGGSIPTTPNGDIDIDKISSFTTKIPFTWTSANLKDMIGPQKMKNNEPNENTRDIDATLFVKLSDVQQRMVAKIPLKFTWKKGTSGGITVKMR